MPRSIREGVEPVTAHDEDVVDAPAIDLGQNLEPILGSFAACPDPKSEDVSFAVDGDTNGGVDGAVGDLAFADLDVDRVDEHHPLHAIAGRFCQPTMASTTGSVIRLIVSFDTLVP